MTRSASAIGRQELATRLAELKIQVSDRSLSYMAKEPGCPVASLHGKLGYRWPDFLPWYIQREREKAKAEVAPTQVNAELRLSEARARKAELEVDELEGELVRVDEFRAKLGAVLDMIRAGMLAIPAKWAPAMVGHTHVGQAQRALEPLVGRMLEDWSSGSGGERPRSHRARGAGPAAAASAEADRLTMG